MKKRSLFSILTLGVLLSGYLSLFGEEVEQTPPASVEFTFDQYEIVIGSTKRQTVLTGFLSAVLSRKLPWCTLTRTTIGTYASTRIQRRHLDPEIQHNPASRSIVCRCRKYRWS